MSKIKFSGLVTSLAFNKAPYRDLGRVGWFKKKKKSKELGAKREGSKLYAPDSTLCSSFSSLLQLPVFPAPNFHMHQEMLTIPQHGLQHKM